MKKHLAAIVVPVVSLLMACGALTPPVQAQGKPTAPLNGDWTGALNAGGTTLRLVFHFTASPNGTLTATVDSLDQGAKGIPFSTAHETDSGAVHLESANIGASFDGQVDALGRTITGQWQQSANSLPLILTRTEHAPAVNRPQEPKPPFPYTVQEVTFPGGVSGVTLAGTLTLPSGGGPFPAVILIAGSGPNDRNETIFGHKPFLLLADTLTRRGIAVLRYDKRGIGSSTGKYTLATTEDFAADTYAAVQFLKTRSEVAPHKIGLLGHSEGGVIAPKVAAAHPSDIAFIVLLAGSALTGEQIMLKQAALIAHAEGASQASIAQNAALQKRLFAICQRESDPIKAQAEARAAILKAGASEQIADAQSPAIASPWFKYFLTYDPAPTLKQTHCPVLALNGSKDLQVPPQEDLAVIAAALKAGGNLDVTTTELPGLNHLFQTCMTGSSSEYAQIEETMAPVVLQTVGDWIVAHTH